MTTADTIAATVTANQTTIVEGYESPRSRSTWEM